MACVAQCATARRPDKRRAYKNYHKSPNGIGLRDYSECAYTVLRMVTVNLAAVSSRNRRYGSLTASNGPRISGLNTFLESTCDTLQKLAPA